MAIQASTPSRVLVLAFMAALAGCGGGAGTSAAPTPSPAPAPAPTVTVALSKAKAQVGGQATLTWSSTEATACTGGGSLTGAEETSGSMTITPVSAGQFQYTISCTGTGGSGSASASLTVPIAVQKSSYLNAKNTGLPAQTLPATHGVNPVQFIAPTEVITAGYAFGDFFQDGSYSMVAFSNNFVPNSDPNYGRTPGHAYFYKKDATGKWVDHTSELLADQTGCISPRKVIVADFNGDGVPDVFVACHGTDLYPLPAGYTSGETPRILLSQPDGTYKNVAAGINCYCHGAAAAEMRGDGYADIVVADPVVHGQPFYLVNNRDGTFTPDYGRMPPATAPNTACAPSCNLGVWSVELVDIDGTGHFDLWLGGSDDHTLGGFASSLFRNPGSGDFSSTAAEVLPASDIAADDNSLDMIFENGNIYLLRVDTTYSQSSIQKINLTTMASSTIYQAGAFTNNSTPFFIWMIPYQGNLVSEDSSYGVSVPQ